MSRSLNIINVEYFNWVCSLVCKGHYSRRFRYGKLLKYLHDREFTYTIALDGNRAEDGIDLRERYTCGFRYKDAEIVANQLNDEPCSILEMMVALAVRCEEHIMDNPDIGDRTYRWFWDMIDNLGLGSMNDSEFDETYVEEVVDRFLNREYEPNGKGGLFTVKRCRYDLRNVEIWYQMCWYLDDI